MDSAFKLILLILVSLAFALQSQNSHSYQNLAIAAGEPDFFRSPVTNFTSARFSANDPIYDPATRTVTTTRPYNVTGLDGKTYQATITKTAAADIPKVGAALSKFAQRVGPLSMALATADLICTLSDICKNASGIFDKVTSLTGVDAVKTHVGWCVSNGGTTPCYPDKDFDDAVKQANACLQSASSNCVVDGVREKLSGSTLIGLEYRFRFISDGSYSPYFPATFMGSYVPPPATGAPATASDWTTAETALSTPAGADRLAAELEPLPIKAPSVFAPISVPLGTATTTNKDALGNATGTQQTTRRMDIEDAATEAEPYRVTVKETETVTNYDLNNSPISSTETVKQSDTPSEPPPPEDIEIDFDESVDRDLQTFEVPGLFSYTPFGGAGSCPADVTENTKFGNVTMSYAPVCRVAEGVKPFVILLAIISAFFIVSGSRQS